MVILLKLESAINGWLNLLKVHINVFFFYNTQIFNLIISNDEDLYLNVYF